VVKKTEDIRLKTYDLPYEKYNWEIGKLGKDFYQTKFGEGIFSANKIKELLTDKEKSNFIKLFTYSNEKEIVGYCICAETNKILHYSYPFYVLSPTSYVFNPNTGIGMMLKAIIWAKENNKKYVYLGSAKDAKAKYKLQFTGLEWFDGKEWKTDLEELKKILE
jgi:arginyl-tRNA--protein-N-Asp/Glu arginylyltransferase